MVFEDFGEGPDWYFEDVIVVWLRVQIFVQTEDAVDGLIIYFRLQPEECLGLFIVIEFSLLEVEEIDGFFAKIFLRLQLLEVQICYSVMSRVTGNFLVYVNMAGFE